MQPNPRRASGEIPAEQLSAFRAFLAQTYQPSTVKMYVTLTRRWGTGDLQLDLGNRSSVNVLRGALTAWSRWADEGVPDLPSPAPIRTRALPLDSEALRAYHAAVETCTDDVCRAALHVLPGAGLSLSMLCALPRVGAESWRHCVWLRGYTEFLDGPWLFPGAGGAAVKPATVHAALVAVRGEHPWTPNRVRRGVLRVEPA